MEPEEKRSYGKRPLWQWIAIYVVLGIIAYGIIYYLFLGKKGNYSSQSNQYQTTQTSAAPTTEGVKQALSFTVSGSEFAFSPSEISAKVGQPVKLTFKNTGKFPHNLTITELNVQSKTIQPGEEDTITFTPEKTGSFTFICTIPGHADRGMKGTLKVE